MARLLLLAKARREGGRFVSDLLAATWRDARRPEATSARLVEQLSSRELEVLRLMAGGCSNQQIADRLIISGKTAKRHASNIFAKLGVSSRTQAISLGRELDLLR